MNLKKIFIVLIINIIVISSQAMAEDIFSISVKDGISVSLLNLPSFKYGGKDGYYFTLTVSVKNMTLNKRTFMIDDDCTFSSWKITGDKVKILTKGCRGNVYDEISLNHSENYESTLKIWFPRNPFVKNINFKIGFVEIVNYDVVSGPYWSDVISVEVKK